MKLYPEELNAWGEDHDTSELICQAILAQAESLTAAERIWATPTDEEVAAVQAAVRRALSQRPGDPEDYGPFYWGIEPLDLS